MPLFIVQFFGAFNDNVFKNALVIMLTFELAVTFNLNPELMVSLAAGLFIFPFFLFSGIAGKIADKFEKSKLIQILLGTLVGGLLILTTYGIWVISAITIGSALLGFFSSFFIPKTTTQDVSLKLSFNFIKETFTILKESRQSRPVWLSIFGISWFWFVGATFLSQFPIYAKSVIGGDASIVTLLLAIFSIGIGLGSILCNRLLKGVVQATYIPIGAFFITLFGLDLFFASQSLVATDALINIGQFFEKPIYWRITIDLILMAVSGGVYIVPLFAILQKNADTKHKSRTIAANNIINALFMVCSALLCMFMFKNGYDVLEIFLLTSILNAFVGIYICKLLPNALPKTVLQFLFKLFYRVEILGVDNFTKAGDRVLIVANHTSLLDAALLVAFLPEKLTFAINTFVAKKWWVKPFLLMVNAFPIDPTNPMATKRLINVLKQNQKCVIFPEGRITRTGSLMKVHEGPGLIADKADAQILPIRINGAQYSSWSYLKKIVRIQWFPKITLTVLPSQKLKADSLVSGRARRKIMGEKLYDLMTNLLFNTSDISETLYQSLLNSGVVHGWKTTVLEDVERRPLNYRDIITRSHVLGSYLSKSTKMGEAVGLLLPNTCGTVVAFWALHAFGRVPAMINFSTGMKNVISSCTTAKLRIIYTSRRFIEMANLEEMVVALELDGFTVSYLEDAKKSISALDKLKGLISARFPGYMYRWRVSKTNRASEKPAVVLFTSGSEGMPKAVVLSHKNIQANRYQVGSIVDFNPKDIVFNALPMFHSFGLTAGTLLPLLSGIKIFLYPSPVHYKVVPEMIYDSNATIMFGTNSFLAGYGKYAHPYDFYSIRYIFAGAEKLQDTVRSLFQTKFGIRIFEGYGATETAPVISINTPMQNKLGTVGKILPGISYTLDPVPGVENGGKLMLSGPNIMLGYWLSEKPGVLVSPEASVYDTGDIVSIDADGFITIQGRAKRFAKVAGEMVSLTAVEQAISKLAPDFMHAVISEIDEKKGEKLILITEDASLDRKILSTGFKAEGISEISVPKVIEHLKKIPLLGTGKIDYTALTQTFCKR